MVEQSCVDASEVGMELQIAVVEVLQARVLTDQSGLLDRPDEEDRSRGAVVGAVRSVLGDPPTKLAEDEQGDAICLSGPSQVVVEGGERVGQFVEQAGVSGKLIGVGVVAVLPGLVNAGPESGFDDPGDLFQPAGQPEVRVRGGAVLLGDLFQSGARLVSGQSAAAEEAE